MAMFSWGEVLRAMEKVLVPTRRSSRNHDVNTNERRSEKPEKRVRRLRELQGLGFQLRIRVIGGTGASSVDVLMRNCAIHLTHAPGSEGREHFIGTEARA